MDQNSEWLLEIGRGYKETFDAWSTADSPFSFVAACQEYARYIDEGEDFVGYLPKSLDGRSRRRLFSNWAMRGDSVKDWIWTEKEVSNGALERLSGDEAMDIFIKHSREIDQFLS